MSIYRENENMSEDSEDHKKIYDLINKINLTIKTISISVIFLGITTILNGLSYFYKNDKDVCKSHLITTDYGAACTHQDQKIEIISGHFACVCKNKGTNE